MKSETFSRKKGRKSPCTLALCTMPALTTLLLALPAPGPPSVKVPSGAKGNQGLLIRAAGGGTPREMLHGGRGGEEDPPPA